MECQELRCRNPKEAACPGYLVGIFVMHLRSPVLGCHQPIHQAKLHWMFDRYFNGGQHKKAEGAAAGIVHSESVSKEREKHSIPEYSYKRIYSTQKWSNTPRHLCQGKTQFCSPSDVYKEWKKRRLRGKDELRLGVWVMNINAVIYQYLVFKVRSLSMCLLGLSLLNFFTFFFFFFSD